MKRYFFCWLLMAACTVIQAQEKFALVIGNGAYTGIKRLNNPVNDAQDMTAALKGLGFTVETVLNGNLEQMESAVSRLRVHLAGSRNSYGFLFYAGHGVQSGGENYLLPVDANIPSENYLRQRAASVQVWLDELNGARNALNVVVLDACRDNPFGWGGRSGSRGMALVAHQPADSIIVYATAAGSTADDGPGRNGLFTGELLKNLKQEGAEVTELFLRTMGDVAQASGNKQRPAVYTQFGGKAYLGRKPQGGAAVAVTPPVVTPPVVTPQPAPAAPPEHPIPGNMVRVEGGTFHMGSTSGDDDEKPVHQVTVKSFYMSKYEVTQKEWREVMGTSAAQQRDMAQRDQNGSGYQLRGEGDNYPMYYVSWLEAVEYCNKRSVKEGLRPAYRSAGGVISCDWSANGYRLPTEAEWEYAAKGVGRDFLEYEYSGGSNVDTVGWYSSNSGSSTHPVGTKAANSLGIYDMSGNVWEWCWDWFGGYGSGAQSDPTGAASGTNRVFRGGSWYDGARLLRSAGRYSLGPSYRIYDLGFRLVRP